jgi:hypothetical protein
LGRALEALHPSQGTSSRCLVVSNLTNLYETGNSCERLCSLCVYSCPILCDVGKSAFRGREVLYPEPEEFGLSTAAANKDFGLDWSDVQLMPRLSEVFGVEPVPEKMIFENVDVSTRFGGVELKLPVFIATLGSTDVA